MAQNNRHTPRKTGVRIPPQSIPSEQAVLGSLMLRKEAMHEVEDVISVDSFYVEKHKMIFRAMQDLANKNEPADMLSLSTKLTEQKLLEAIGGSQYLAEIANVVPSSTNIKHYADIVQKKYVLRSLIEAADYVSELAFEEGDDHMSDILDMAEKRIFSVVSSPKNQKFINLKDALPEAYERLEKLHEHKGMLRGLPTGFRDLDTILSGFQQSVDIMLSAESRVNAWNLRTGRLSSDKEFSQLRDSLDKLAKAQIYIDDQPGNSIVRMKALSRRLKAEKGLDLIVVDYLQLMTTSKNYDSMVNQVTEISRSLKSLAKELDVPVLALSQLSRAVESRGGKPR